jgi:hypothetical protein
MSGLRVKLSRLTATRVPALSLIVVAIAGMAIGVFAATISVGTTGPYGGEQGFTHNNTGVLTVTDSGLSVVNTVPGGGVANNTSNFLTTGNKNAFSNAHAYAVGDWLETLVFTDTSTTDTTAHAVKITINQSGTAPSGTNVIPQVTYTMTGVTGSSNPTITLYIDLGTANLTAPLSIYINSN